MIVKNLNNETVFETKKGFTQYFRKQSLIIFKLLGLKLELTENFWV